MQHAAEAESFLAKSEQLASEAGRVREPAASTLSCQETGSMWDPLAGGLRYSPV